MIQPQRYSLLLVLLSLAVYSRAADDTTASTTTTAASTTSITPIPITTSTTIYNPPTSHICKPPKRGYNISTLTTPPYWAIKINQGCDFVKEGNPNCLIYMSFCRPIEDGALLGCDGSSACLRYGKNQVTTVIVGNFTADPFDSFEKDGFKADYPSGGDFPNRYTNKTCSITISTTFYCDPDADWNVTSINAPGEAPFPTTFEFSSPNCMINMRLPYPGACIPKPPDNDTGLSGGSVLLIIFFVSVFAYLSIGIVYNIFVEKKSGTNVIPHYKIWAFLMIASIEGVVFTWRKVTCQTKQGNTYDNI